MIKSHCHPFVHRSFAVAGYCAVLLLVLLSARAAERPLAETEFRQRLDEVRTAGDDAARLQRARRLFPVRQLSSLQVKAIAQTIASEDARIEFAVAAFPLTVDPENFYEVYDAFTTFSKVFRLHDRIRAAFPPPLMPATILAPAMLTDTELADLVAALKKEPFDDGKLQMGKQALTSARGRLAAKQIRELLALFAFDDGRLELAKTGYDCAADPWNYHVVYEAFAFNSNREKLARYLESRAKPGSAPSPRR